MLIRKCDQCDNITDVVTYDINLFGNEKIDLCNSCWHKLIKGLFNRFLTIDDVLNIMDYTLKNAYIHKSNYDIIYRALIDLYENNEKPKSSDVLNSIDRIAESITAIENIFNNEQHDRNLKTQYHFNIKH